jgi:hypothetical protein
MILTGMALNPFSTKKRTFLNCLDNDEIKVAQIPKIGQGRLR